MFVSKRAFRAAQEEVDRLRRELEQARTALAGYSKQERELVEALVAARVEARELRSRADNEAGAVVASARDEAAGLQAEARAQFAAAESEIARLRAVQRDLTASLEQSLAMLQPVLPQGSIPQPPRAIDRPPEAPPRWDPLTKSIATEARLAPSSEALEQFQSIREALSPPAQQPAAVKGHGPGQRTEAPLEPPPVAPWSARKVVRAAAAAGRKLPRGRAAAGVTVLAVALAVGGTWWWRGSTGQAAPGTDGAGSALVDEAGASPVASGGTSAVAGPNSFRVKVALRAVRPVWLRAEVDGRQAMARMVRAGEELEFGGSRDLVLRAGDAGALLIAVNGRAHVPFGRNGEVLTSRITADQKPKAPAQPASRPLDAQTIAPSAPAVPAPKAALVQPSPAGAAQGTPLPRVTGTPRPVAELPQTLAAGRRAAAPAAFPPHPVEPSPALSAGPATSTDEGDVLRAHEAYFEALRRGDSGQMNRLVAEGFTATGAPAADESGVPYPLSLRNASVEIRGVGAVVSGSAAQHVSSPDGQNPRVQQLLFSEVWVKRDGQWQLMNVRFVSPGGGR